MARTRLLSLALLLGTGTLAFAAARLAPLGQEPPMPQPTKEHDMLLKSVGEYEGTLTMSGPEAPTTEPIKAKEKITAIGKFWTQGKFECDFMGMPFMGASTTGYDTAKKKYVGTWIDSMTTEIIAMEGEMEGNKLVMRWEAPDHATGKRMMHRSESEFTADGYTMNFFKGDGAGEKSMTIVMKRKAAGAAK